MISITKWIDNFGTIKLERHQRLILDHVFAFDKDGRLPYETIIYSAPKKSGKTEINSLVMLYWLYNIEAPNEIICVANKKDQALARGFKRGKEIIQKNPFLSGELVSMTQDTIALKNGSTLLGIPNDFAGEAGSNHGLTLWDELWGFTSERDRRLFEELTPVPIYFDLCGLRGRKPAP